jgi:hypothetical protein
VLLTVLLLDLRTNISQCQSAERIRGCDVYLLDDVEDSRIGLVEVAGEELSTSSVSDFQSSGDSKRYATGQTNLLLAIKSHGGRVAGSDARAGNSTAGEGRPGDSAQDTRGASQAGDGHGEGVELKQQLSFTGDGRMSKVGESRLEETLGEVMGGYLRRRWWMGR